MDIVNMHSVEVSVIVPVYNAQKYIERGLQSLLDQTLKSIEIICVNDASTDDSLSVLNSMREKYPEKIKVFTVEHGGVYKAREFGISVAQGKYMGFMDCDDLVSPQMYQLMYERIKDTDSDMVVCGFERVDRNENKTLSREMIGFGNQVLDVSSDKSMCMVINVAMWNKLVRAEVAKRHIHLENPPRVLEDMMYFLSIYSDVNKVAMIGEVLYTYYVSGQTVLNNVTKEDILVIQDSMLEVKNFVMEKQLDTNMKNLMAAMAFIHFGISWILYSTNGNFKEIVAEERRIKKWLNENFEGWNKNPYLKFYRVLQGKKNLLKPSIVLYLYRMGLFPLLIKFYKFITEKLKFDVKW